MQPQRVVLLVPELHGAGEKARGDQLRVLGGVLEGGVAVVGRGGSAAAAAFAPGGRLGGVGLLGGLAAPVLQAQNAPSASTPWRNLTPAQRDVLAPLRQEWNGMPPHRQQHLLEKSEQWVTLPPAQREEIRERIEHWQQMSPAERQQARENQRLFRRLPPAQREQLHAAYQRFQQLPPEQRACLPRFFAWLDIGPDEKSG